MVGAVRLRIDRRVLNGKLVLHAHRIAIFAQRRTQEKSKLEHQELAASLNNLTRTRSLVLFPLEPFGVTDPRNLKRIRGSRVATQATHASNQL
jgi:hypothetical protein